MRDRLMRYAFFAMFIVALIAGGYALLSAAGGKSLSTPLERFQTGAFAKLDFSHIGEHAGAAGFTAPDGSDATFSDFKGQALLVNYWATWCAPCERELPSLGLLQSARGGEGFTVLAISVDAEKDRDYAGRRLDELTGGMIPFYQAADYAPVYPTGVRGFPTTIFYDAAGVEVFRLEGEADWSSIEALALVDAALGE